MRSVDNSFTYSHSFFFTFTYQFSVAAEKKKPLVIARFQAQFFDKSASRDLAVIELYTRQYLEKKRL